MVPAPTITGEALTVARSTLRAAASPSSTSFGLLPSRTRVHLTGATSRRYSQIVHGGDLRWVLTVNLSPVAAG